MDEPAHLRLFDALWRFKWIVLSTAISGGLIAALVAFLTAPVYRTQVVLIPADNSEEQNQLSSLMGQFGGLAGLAGVQIGGAGDSKNETIATLNSRELTTEFIRDENLLPVLFSDDWDESSGQWDVDDESDIPTEWDAFELFDEEIRTVVEDLRSGLIILNIEWTDRMLAAEWANRLVERVNVTVRQKTIREAERSVEYLNRELEKTSIVELRGAIYRMIESQINKIMFANVREEYALRVIDPAVVPDADEYVKPRRLLLIALGIVLGGLLGGLFALFGRELRQSA